MNTAPPLLQDLRIQGPPENGNESSISCFKLGLGSLANFGNAAFSRIPWYTPPNRSGQSTKTSLNLMTADLGSVVSMESIEVYPTVVYAPVVLRMAFQVKSKSAEVIGDPSAQTDLSLILYVMVNGFSVSNPFSNEGASRNRGEATKLAFGSSCMALGRTCSRTVYQVHGDAGHSLIGLMHS